MREFKWRVSTFSGCCDDFAEQTRSDLVPGENGEVIFCIIVEIIHSDGCGIVRNHPYCMPLLVTTILLLVPVYTQNIHCTYII